MKVEIAFIWVIPHSFLKFKLPHKSNRSECNRLITKGKHNIE